MSAFPGGDHRAGQCPVQHHTALGASWGELSLVTNSSTHSELAPLSPQKDELILNQLLLLLQQEKGEKPGALETMVLSLIVMVPLKQVLPVAIAPEAGARQGKHCTAPTNNF